MERIFNADEIFRLEFYYIKVIEDLRRELKEERKQKTDIQTKYDKLIGKLKTKNITPEQQEIMSIFHPIRLDDPTKKYNYDDMDLSEY